METITASTPAASAWLWPSLLVLAALLLSIGLLAWRLKRTGARLEAANTRIEEGEGLALPGLVGRPRFDAALDEAVNRCDQRQGSLCVLFVNLDNFRSVNDSFGFGGGDGVIAQAAKRLLELAGAGAVVSRMGGDEFLLLLPRPLNEASELAARLVKALVGPYRLGSRDDIALGCSIGLAAYPQHGSRPLLVSHANSAMRAVKLAGGGDHMVFEPRMAVDGREQAELLQDLRQAVAKGEFELYFQPKVDARSLQITAAEALLRWHHPKRGLVSPMVFIPMAERHGLIGPIGDWVIADACRQAAEWRDQGLRMRVAINISPYQMRQDDLVDRLVGTLLRHKLQPGRFTCEITESVAMEDTQITKRTFDKMRQAGLHVSIDDFGVGQTSLSYLRRLPAAELKIDASFVQDIAASADSHSIVKALVNLAHALNLRVVAEGVETEAQRDALVHIGCDELQGYLFAKPMSARALGLWALDDGERPEAQFRSSLFQDTQPMASL
ncbi:putative bifunctional diguanylate cyclase/phosphodiesterase [Aquabacterium sp.]|uniref:putative bifunctional diguanylate cyclase/phosphodiesterase n=1 Tax=Aquabacterium sp. TaxID=1872578 RepID=UPI0037845FCC